MRLKLIKSGVRVKLAFWKDRVVDLTVENRVKMTYKLKVCLIGWENKWDFFLSSTCRVNSQRVERLT